MHGELMSRLGKKLITIPASVKVELQGGSLKAKGPMGEFELDIHPLIKVTIDSTAGTISVANENTSVRLARQMHGTTRSLIANVIEGVSKGFEKKMEIYGTGYNAKEQNGQLVLQVGYCNPVSLPIPAGVKVKIDVPAARGNDTPAVVTLSSADKCLLGRFASEIRKVREPEPYLAKGIRYAGEHIKRKVGKALTSGTV